MAVNDKNSRLVDYFVICGLDESSGLEADKLSGENVLCPPLDRHYKSKVLAHFPQSVSWNPFAADAVSMMCLPKGCCFKAQKESRQPKFHSFLITREDGSKTYGSSLVFYEEVTNKSIVDSMHALCTMHKNILNVSSIGKQSRLESDRDKLFVSKCICLVTSLPFVRSCRQFLAQLYEASTKPAQLTLTLESYVFNLIYDVPLPPPGRSLKFYGCSGPICILRPGTNELPLLDFSLYDMFELLGVNIIVDIFKCVLLEHQILLYSSDYQRLMQVAEGVVTLVFPFLWQLVYVPILPAAMQHFLDAPVPYIMGLHKAYNEDRASLVLPSEANMCFVDLEKKDYECPEDLPEFPYENELKGELLDVLHKFQNVIGAEKISKSFTIGTKKKEFGSTRTTTTALRSHNSSNSPKRKDVLQQSEAWKKISSLAKQTGLWDSVEDTIEDIEKGLNPQQEDEVSVARIPREPEGMASVEINDLKFNNTVREIFLNCFVHMFASYENFVINPSQDLEAWMSNRESVHSFDKAAFLSDQPAAHLPFLSAFIETQMFTTLMDNKIISQWEEAEPNLKLFDDRIKELKEAKEAGAGEEGEGPRIITYRPSQTLMETGEFIEKRAQSMDYIATRPHEIASHISPSQYVAGIFPLLSTELLNSEPANKSKFRENSKWRRKDRQLQHKEHLQTSGSEPDQQERYLQFRKPQIPPGMPSEGSHAQTKWNFVDTLLKECKAKTKRLLVDKMGQEAVELGHSDASITGVEENTLIASLCDLLERIWSHGLQTKKGKSAVWSHLRSHQEREEGLDNKANECKMLTAGLPKRNSLIDLRSLVDGSFTILGRSISLSNLSTMESDKAERPPEKTHRRRSSQGRIELPVLRPMPKALLSDMKKVQQMSDIRTEVGRTRALIRLALERKMLSAYLKQLLSDTNLLRDLYKRYAFLRCEDEREQFLYHLLSLNAVDFFCFTNTFPNTVVPYRVLIFPSTKLGCSTTSANVWISVAGQKGETGLLDFPKSQLELSLEHRNLGVLTTLRIGHDNSGMMARWLVEYVLVRNELTGHTYRFNCGRWLGRGVDDGSTERLLVGELLHHTIDTEDEVVVTSPPRTCSPKSPRKQTVAQSAIAEIQENLGQAVNNLVKHFYKPEKERGNITFLLCGDRGLVHCMEQVFQYGFRSSRLFRNKIFIWDYMERLKTFFETTLNANGGAKRLTEVYRAGYWLFCDLVGKINTASDTVGKDGKFQVFICVGIRKQCLHRWLPLVANTTITAQMYEENSFLRNPSHINFVMHILDSLSEFTIPLEASLLRGIHVEL